MQLPFTDFECSAVVNYSGGLFFGLGTRQHAQINSPIVTSISRFRVYFDRNLIFFVEIFTMCLYFL